MSTARARGTAHFDFSGSVAVVTGGAIFDLSGGRATY
jgi:hypothetical protein